MHINLLLLCTLEILQHLVHYPYNVALVIDSRETTASSCNKKSHLKPLDGHNHLTAHEEIPSTNESRNLGICFLGNCLWTQTAWNNMRSSLPDPWRLYIRRPQMSLLVATTSAINLVKKISRAIEFFCIFEGMPLLN